MTKDERLTAAAIAAVAALIIAVNVYAWMDAPCWLWTFAKLGPARCG